MLPERAEIPVRAWVSIGSVSSPDGIVKDVKLGPHMIIHIT